MNEKQAIELVRRESPTLIITDIFMPEADGLETIRAIRKDSPEAKIIAISGGGEAIRGDFLHIAKTLGAHRILTKPLVRRELMEAVAALVHTSDDSPSPRQECWMSD